MWKVWMDTRKFSFEAFGSTKAAAKEALRAGVVRHAKAYGVDPEVMWAEYAVDLCYVIVRDGCCIRDNEEI
jgi:hypothetical protein